MPDTDRGHRGREEEVGDISAHKELDPNHRSPYVLGVYYVVVSLILTTKLLVLLLSPGEFLENEVQEESDLSEVTQLVMVMS